MAYTTIDKSSLHFNSKPYSGGSSPNAITGVGFKPDFLWIKPRNLANSNRLHTALLTDTDYYIMSENTDAEATNNNCVTSFDTDGFTLGNTDNGWNDSSYNYASWNWKAAGTSGSANSDGATSSTVSVNTTAGFSLVKWTGTGSTTTIGHGLGATPHLIFTKSAASSGWGVYHQSTGNTKSTPLNETGGGTTHAAYWNNTSPTSSVFTVNSDSSVNHSGNTMYAMCWTEKTGYSKFGSYVGNASTDGTFVYTGFKPELIIMKESSASGQGWCMKTFDLNSSEGNPNNYFLKANTYSVEHTSDTSFGLDFLSNGFKIRSSDGIMNGSGDTFIYMAWAKAPLVGSNNVPCTAR